MSESSSRIFGSLFVASILLMTGGYAQTDSGLTPYDQIPQLVKFKVIASYDSLIAGGTTVPDRITIDSVTIGMGTSEKNLRKRFTRAPDAEDSAVYRTRTEQWDYLQRLQRANDNTMHFYEIHGIYYEQQLSGWFKTCEWRIGGVGKIKAFLMSKSKAGAFHVWLLYLECDPIARDRISYKKGAEHTLVRNGERVVEWDITTNRMIIE
jgi:hypothetical protein